MTTPPLLSMAELERTEQRNEEVCLLCGGTLHPKISGLFDTRFGIAGTYNLCLCVSCGLEQLTQRPAPDELKSLYEQYYNFGGQTGTRYTKLREWFFSSFLYRLWTLLDGDISFHRVRGSGRLLDVGCNEGRGLEIYRRNGFDVEGLELNERSANIARRKGFTVHTDLLEDFRPEAAYEVVVVSNVLEHSLDPRAMLTHISRVLKPGGHVWISCPNARSWLRSIFGVCWINWHVPFHISFFSPTSLRALLKETGFCRVSVRQITPALWISSSIVALVFARRGRMTTELRSPRLIPGLVLLTRGILFPLLFLGNRLGRGDCLVLTATRSALL